MRWRRCSRRQTERRFIRWCSRRRTGASAILRGPKTARQLKRWQQCCAIVVRALDLAEEKTQAFTDVSQTDWFCGFVGAASSAGIVNGIGSGKFAPQGAITREQAATMLARASKQLGLSGQAKHPDAALAKYPDAAKAQAYAADALAFCAENGILEEDHTELKPAEAICRGEVAQMVWNLLKAAGEV